MSGSALLFSNFGIHIIYFEEIPMYYEWNRWKMKWSMCLGTQTTWWNYTLARMGTHVALLHTIFPSFNRILCGIIAPRFSISFTTIVHLYIHLDTCSSIHPSSALHSCTISYSADSPNSVTLSLSLSLAHTHTHLVQLTSLFSLLSQFLSFASDLSSSVC